MILDHPSYIHFYYNKYLDIAHNCTILEYNNKDWKHVNITLNMCVCKVFHGGPKPCIVDIPEFQFGTVWAALHYTYC